MKYIIENENIKAEICDVGATLVSFVDKKSGKDIVLGFDDEQSYLKEKNYFGASVGRNANRIAGGKITINDIEYKLSINDNMNQLHGGIENFAFKTWKVKSKGKDFIILTYFSKDGEEGFPGNVNVEVTYEIKDNNLYWTYSGKSDKDTILNMTNHSYFNLGDDTIYNHELKVYSDKYSPTDDFALTLDKIIDVKGTPYDFVNYSLIGNNISGLKQGIDNNYVFENMEDKQMASLRYDHLELNVFSDLPDMHLYTSSSLSECTGKNAMKYKKYSGVCLECQFYPNAINYETFIKPILRKDEIIRHFIRYEIKQI